MTILKKQNVLHVNTNTGGVYIPRVPQEALRLGCEFVSIKFNEQIKVIEVKEGFLHELENEIRDFLRTVNPLFPAPLR